MSCNVIYLHFVWTTSSRAAWIGEGEIEARLYGCIRSEVEKRRGKVLAIGGMPDHVHLLVQPTLMESPSKLMQQVKGVSSRLATECLGLSEFRWQEGYAVFSVSRGDLDRVRRYVAEQKRRHASRCLWPTAENVGE